MIRRLQDAKLANRRVLVRADFNVPMSGRQISDDSRLRAALPTINYIRNAGAISIITAHFGRPNGQRDLDMSLALIATPLSELLGVDIKFVMASTGGDAKAAISSLKPGDVLLLENTRFDPREERNDPEMAKELAELADIYVNDAFSAAHRAHASTHGIARLLPSYAGLALQYEIDQISAALETPYHPVMAIVGGSKVSTKIALLKNLVNKVDRLFVGGAMANTFLAARGLSVGSSLYERDLLEVANEIETIAGEVGCQIILPVDGALTSEFKENAERRIGPVTDIKGHEMMLDCGPLTLNELIEAVEVARTLVWNGPIGAFETRPFDKGTVELARFVANQCKTDSLTAVAGGGDTLAALNHAGVSEDFTFVSTAGGAFLEWLEGKTLPGIRILQNNES